MVSTDKAVNPTNVMGASKRICEMILTAHSQSDENRTQFVITRFGNVLGSNGSVVPIFKRQIEEGGPVTVTHPDITRYFMTIPEASQLVLEAGFMGMGGEIFVFDMGEPVRIAQLARQMITLSGYETDRDIKIEYTGLRPGEKLHEELLADQERLLPTYNSKVKVAQVDKVKPKLFLEQVHRLMHSFQLNSEAELVEKIATIVPEFETNNERFAQDKSVDNGKQAALVEL
jgi:FlaA1/EpsC-like NDP-sugar epimerase